MAINGILKRDKRIETARRIATETRKPFIDPQDLFAHASNDDLELYTPEMIAASAAHAASEIGAWDGKVARITIAALPPIEPKGRPASVLAITARNMPFLYDSAMGEVTSSYRDIAMVVHPVLVAEPGKPIVLYTPDGHRDPAHRISHIQIHLASLTDLQAESLIERVATVLARVQSAVSDWKPMLSKLDATISELAGYASGRKKADRDEALAFLDWLRRDNFTFLGMRDYTYTGRGADAKVERGRGSGLGLLADPDVLVLRQGKDAVTSTPEILSFLESPDFLIVTKANVKSTVHRRAYMDYIGVKRFDGQGNVIGELRIVGLFTSTAYTKAASEIPLLRSKVEKVIGQFGFDPESHSGKLLLNTLDSYPRDDLFQIEPGLLATFCEQINELTDRPRVRVLPRIDHFDRFVSVIVYVPREEYNSAVRERIGEYLKTIYDGRVSAYYPAFPEGSVARVHFIIGRSSGKTPKISQARLEAAVRDIASGWDERLAALGGPGLPVIAVSQAYQEAFTPEETVGDLERIRACLEPGAIRIAFHNPTVNGANILSLKIFHGHAHLALSRRVPLLENLGFTVISERTFDIEVRMPDNGASGLVVLHDMELAPASGSIDLARDRAALEDAFLSAFDGRIDDDSFNRLVLSAGLQARQVSVLRAYARYIRQAGIAYSQDYIADTLNKYPAIAADLYQLFETALDPALAAKTRARRQEQLREKIETALGFVPNLDDDRILRRYVNAIGATLRTNYFQRNADGSPKAMLAFKLDPKALEGLPDPRPFREIFVYGVEVEGVHLRFGKVARGGIRWSDRPQDYRTEVLGLVKAQQVKNAVIVPVGAKGGFFPKQLPVGGNRDAVFAAGTQAYKTYIRTLLSITDNIDGANVVPPADTLRLDGDDPYFVVAADKGTATFSDTANALAQEAGFWLDDAFASGGSAGYDHKKMGITARGGWEAVKRHFRELGTDIQTTPFTVAGVGDMSGDVFGNGMLLSKKIRLIAAFDHRDILIDPDPDMALSFAERKRLFGLSRSSWQDYDRAALSKGAMIISRADKSVKLTREAARAIGLDKTTATPFEILTAILKAPVDLLWFGGIGTYIRAESESDADVGDRANDPIRVTATDVRARVIGEGANLGVTQKGRIAYSLAGGRCNSDAIDNSAGVNSSDVEVNIKIALASAMRDGRLTRVKRNQLLASMTDEVAKLVLRNNYLQSLAISLTEARGTANGQELMRLMDVLQAGGQLNRKVETLPDDITMTERYGTGKPLTRPEIGVLLSYSKIVLFDQLIASDLPDDPYLTSVLRSYFPAKMHKIHAADIASHRLRREIIATLLANETINRGGPAFVVQMIDATGATAADVVKAAFLVRDGLELDRRWADVDALDTTIPGRVQNRLYAELGDIHASVTRLLLRAGMAAGDIEAASARLGKAVKALSPLVATLLPQDLADEIAAKGADLAAAGIPDALAEDVARLSALVPVPEIMRISEETGERLPRAAAGYFEISGAFRVGRLLAAASRITTTDHYDGVALARSMDQISAARMTIAIKALELYKKEKQPFQALEAGKREQILRMRSELSALVDSGEPTLSRMAVAAGLLGDLTMVRVG